MCTITYNEPKLKIAKEDITVYKRIRIKRKFLFFKSYESEITRFKYKKDKVYETDLGSFLRDSYRMLDGKCYYESTTGFYSYKDPNWFVNAVFRIPKGSQYYLCKDSKSGYYIYHSDKIKLIKILK